jgi:hypothetical protein
MLKPSRPGQTPPACPGSVLNIFLKIADDIFAEIRGSHGKRKEEKR